MKPMPIGIFILSLLGFGTSAMAAVNVACEREHKVMVDKLMAEVQQVPNAQFQNFILNGSDSGISIFSLDQDAIKIALAERKTPASGSHGENIKGIVNSVKCGESSITGVKRVVKFFKADDLQNAALTLNALKGLRGVRSTLASLAPDSPRQETVVADNVDLHPVNGEDQSPETVQTYPNGPFSSSVDNPPALGNDPRRVPQGFMLVPTSLIAGGYPEGGLTRKQWDRLLLPDSPAKLIGGQYYAWGSATHPCEQPYTRLPEACRL